MVLLQYTRRSLLLVIALLNASVFAESFSAKVVSVARGDILKIERAGKTELVQLYGIQCPASSTAYGSEAKALTEEALLGKTIRLDVRKRQSGLTYVSVSTEAGPSLAQLLLTNGFAKRDRFAAPDADALDALERDARNNARGLWGDVAPPPLFERIDGSGKALDDFRQRRELARLAEFEHAVSLWHSMPEEEREAVRASARRAAQTRGAQDAQRLEQGEQAVSRLSAQENESRRNAEDLRGKLGELSVRERAATATARNDKQLREDERILDALQSGWEESMNLETIEVQNQYHRHLHTVEYEKRVEARREELDAEVADIADAFARRRQEIQASVSGAESKRAALVRDRAAAAAERDRSRSLARKHALRDRERLSRIAALDETLTEEYQPTLTARPLGAWSGGGEQETEPFTVRAGVCVVDLNAFDAAGDRGISVDVYRVEDQRIITRLTNDGPRYASFAIVDTPGHYYLKINSRHGLRYEVRAVAYR